MAGFLPLSFARLFLVGGMLMLGAPATFLLAAPVSAAPGTTNAAPTAPVPPTPTSVALNKITGAPPPPVPPPLDEYFSRYGKILSLNDQAPYPFKLTMPFPGVGEVKVPSKEELEVRQKLEQLVALSDAQLRDQLEKWPAFSKMSLGDEGAMLTRIQQFRDHRNKVAMETQHRLGLTTLNPAQQARFETEYWDKRLKMDQQLSQQLDPLVKAAEQKLNEDLFREFSSPGTLAQGVKPPAPPPAPEAGKPATNSSAAPMMMH